MKRYMLSDQAFIGGVLLAAGSIISDDDLPFAPLRNALGKLEGDPVRSAPPEGSIEVDQAGQAIDPADNMAILSIPIAEPVLSQPAPDALEVERLANEADVKRAAHADELAAASERAEAAVSATGPKRRGG